jgi:hypothetical protein
MAALVIACFRAWSDQYRDAHPYDEETLAHAQRQFESLTEEEKGALEELAIATRASKGEFWSRLEAMGLVKRDHGLKLEDVPDYALFDSILDVCHNKKPPT